jgi:hypothetical protein
MSQKYNNCILYKRMRSFWYGIEHSLEDRDLMRLGYSGGNIEKLVNRIKIFNNRHVKTITINGSPLKLHEQESVKQFIEEYRNDDLCNNFYFSSRREPFLILLAEVLNISIKVDFEGEIIYYKNTNFYKKTLNYRVRENNLEFIEK